MIVYVLLLGLKLINLPFMSTISCSLGVGSVSLGLGVVGCLAAVWTLPMGQCLVLVGSGWGTLRGGVGQGGGFGGLGVSSLSH